MLHDLIFLNSDRPNDQFWLVKPKVGDELPIGIFGGPGLEIWTIVKVQGRMVVLQKSPTREQIDATVEYELMQHQMLQLELEHSVLVQKIVDLREKMILAKR